MLDNILFIMSIIYVSYLIIKSKQLDQIKESEVDDDTIPF